MKLFLTFAALLALLFGLMLLIAPAQFYQPTGMVLTPMLATLAQAHGATLTGMAVVLWLSRSATGRNAVAVLAGNLIVQVLSLFVVLRTMNLGAGGAVMPGVIIHTLLGAGFFYFLLRALRASPSPN